MMGAMSDWLMVLWVSLAVLVWVAILVAWRLWLAQRAWVRACSGNHEQHYRVSHVDLPLLWRIEICDAANGVKSWSLYRGGRRAVFQVMRTGWRLSIHRR